ncbi:Hypothetical protein MAG6430 [Mycoplasmopsis agalactiae PG2]|uniref:Uncharacterized protein n=1 Tax=Mycoplasmopsis agalactiae (strain NCTC 10123 / CIP 59.7 / PG2) TaxID=347257 RepID=A5IZ84_MYCAP|nr:Hypothetical protein MAG6430 [Mycoplasmopsis agalactiae PG2]
MSIYLLPPRETLLLFYDRGVGLLLWFVVSLLLFVLELLLLLLFTKLSLSFLACPWPFVSPFLFWFWLLDELVGLVSLFLDSSFVLPSLHFAAIKGIEPKVISEPKNIICLFLLFIICYYILKLDYLNDSFFACY